MKIIYRYIIFVTFVQIYLITILLYMNVFITNWNSKRIIDNIDISNISVEDEIYEINFKWFNMTEIKNLLAFKQLYKNPNDFFKMYKKREKIDTYQYIYENAPPAYHISDTCERMLSNFRNYKLPRKVREGGLEEISKFRSVFGIYQNTQNSKARDLLLEKIMKRFNIDEPLEIVDFTNSNIKSKNNLDLTQLEDNITKLIESAEKYYLLSRDNRTTLDNYGISDIDYRILDKKMGNILDTFSKNYKNPIISLLKEYYRVKYNPNLEFEGLLLDTLGFVCCSTCFKRKI